MKKLKQKTVSILIAMLCIVEMIYPNLFNLKFLEMKVSADESLGSVTVEGIQYEIYADYAILWNCTATVTNISIPETIRGVPVTSVMQGAFDDVKQHLENVDGILYADNWVIGFDSDITTISFPNNTIGIADYAFYECKTITSVSMPQSMRYIGDCAFWMCTSLDSVTMSDMVIYNENTFSGTPWFIKQNGNNELNIVDGVVKSNQNVTGDIIIPYGAKTIEYSAFENCIGLTSVVIPETVTEIGYGAFKNCKNLTSITIPGSIENPGTSMLAGCVNLREVVLQEGVSIINRETFSGCSSLTSVNLPHSLKSIEYRAFEDCTSLTELNIPEGVVSIDINPFYGCSSLSELTLPDSLEYLSSSFNYSTKLKEDEKDYVVYFDNWMINTIGISGRDHQSFAIRNGTIGIADGATDYATYYLTIPSSVKFINNPSDITCYHFVVSEDNQYYCAVDGVLYNKSQISLLRYPTKNNEEKVIISDGIVEIQESAFRDCNQIIDIYLPDTVTTIYDCAFWSARNLKSVTIENPECEFDGYFVFPSGVTICGYKGSTAEDYAQNRNLTFKVIGETMSGDVNSDGEFTVADVVLLQKWLLAVPDVKLANWKAADLCEDGRLDVFDLCLLKRMLVENS